MLSLPDAPPAGGGAGPRIITPALTPIGTVDMEGKEVGLRVLGGTVEEVEVKSGRGRDVGEGSTGRSASDERRTRGVLRILLFIGAPRSRVRVQGRGVLEEMGGVSNHNETNASKWGRILTPKPDSPRYYPSTPLHRQGYCNVSCSSTQMRSPPALRQTRSRRIYCWATRSGHTLARP